MITLGNPLKVYHVERAASGIVCACAAECGETELLVPLDDISGLEGVSFDMGFPGSGASQLALSICFDVLDEAERAMAVHIGFAKAVISRIGTPLGGPIKWEMSHAKVLRIIEKIERHGWQAVVEEFDRNRPFRPEHSGQKAFTKGKR